MSAPSLPARCAWPWCSRPPSPSTATPRSTACTRSPATLRTRRAAGALPRGVRERLPARPHRSARWWGAARPKGREWYRRYWASSLDVPGPDTERLGAIAREYALHLVIGVIERRRWHALLHRALLRPRRHPARQAPQAHAHRRRTTGVGTGRRQHHAGAPHGRSARWAPPSAGRTTCPCTAWHSTGSRCSSTSPPRPTAATPGSPRCGTSPWKGAASCSRPTSVRDGRDYPADYPLEAPEIAHDAILTRGGSCIVHPLGELLAGPVYDEDRAARGRPRPRRHHSRQVRLRRHRTLRASRHLRAAVDTRAATAVQATSRAANEHGSARARGDA